MTAVVRKAVFPVAGLGTRFLPATKASPKEMLPIVDKPLIQYAVEEAVAAGITQLIFVTSSSKRAIEDHFDANQELERVFAEQNRTKLLNIAKNIIPENVSCVYVRQKYPLGLGHAVLCAKDIVNDEPFAVLLADDLIDGGNRSCMQQMLEVYQRTNSSVLAVQQVADDETRKYGIVELVENQTNITNMMEKPAPTATNSRLAVVGRYILSPKIFSLLETVGFGAGGEIQLTDGIKALLGEEKVYTHLFSGKRYDCGSKLGYLQATVEYALQHAEVGGEFKGYLKDLTLAVREKSQA